MQSSPTLVGTGVSNDQHGFVRVPLTSSRAVLPDLRVTDSSEAMLSGRKPPLRLMMRAVYKDTLQPVPHIRHAISEGFVVAVRGPLRRTVTNCPLLVVLHMHLSSGSRTRTLAPSGHHAAAARLQTRRTRTAGKVEIPSVEDHVSKLEHMGRETVKKLSDVREAAVQAGIDDLALPPAFANNANIDTVGKFQKIALAADQVRWLPHSLPSRCPLAGAGVRGTGVDFVGKRCAGHAPAEAAAAGAEAEQGEVGGGARARAQGGGGGQPHARLVGIPRQWQHAAHRCASPLPPHSFCDAVW